MKYATTQIIYHWLSALLILVMILSGLAFSYEWAGAWVIRAHQVAGQILIVVLALRIVAKIRHRSTHQDTHNILEKIAAQTVHASLYLCMIAYVVSGYISASGLNNPFLIWPIDKSFARSDMGETILDWHYSLKWVLLALVTLHVLGALKHLLWDKDDTFSHMTLRPRKD
jgi:cytochrome b561